MACPAKYPDTARLASELAEARAAGVLWKQLCYQYGLSRTRLYEIWRAAPAAKPDTAHSQALRLTAHQSGSSPDGSSG